MRNLSCGVHAGIGAPGDHEANVAAQDPPQGVFERALHGAQPGLRRPPAEVGSVVRDVEPDPARFRSRKSTLLGVRKVLLRDRSRRIRHAASRVSASMTTRAERAAASSMWVANSPESGAHRSLIARHAAKRTP